MSVHRRQLQSEYKSDRGRLHRGQHNLQPYPKGVVRFGGGCASQQCGAQLPLPWPLPDTAGPWQSVPWHHPV